MALVARFVDSIAAGRTVRMDLNDGVIWRLLESSRFDPPRGRYVRVANQMADGAIYPSVTYDDRILALRWLLDAPIELATAEMQRLARELDRPRNFFEYQPPGAASPKFFHTWRLGLDTAHMPTDGAIHNVDANIPADSYGYGLREDIGTVTVNNDPAAGSNGMYVDITGVKGDVETPLLISVDHASLGFGALSSAYGIRRRGTPSQMPLFLQCEAMTLMTDTTLPGNDTLMSGAGSNYARCSFATVTSMDNRLFIGRFPTSASVDARGTYRVWLRTRQSTTDQFNIRLGYGASDLTSGANFFNDTVATTTTNRKWLDMGLVPIPAGPDPVYAGHSGVEIAARGVSLAIQAQRIGSGTLDFDALLLMPADERLGTVKWIPENLGSDNYVLDGVTDTVYALEGTTEIRTLPGVITRTAAIPKVLPGVTNRLVWMQNAGPNNQQDSITATTALTLSYWPRFL